MDENTNIGAEQSEPEVKSYTEQEVQELLQREGDRRVSEALKKFEKKNADKLKEAERLAKMDEQQKYEYQLEQREKAIVEKEKELAMAENKNAASKILADKGISLDLVDFIVAEDADTMNANITLLDKAFKASVKAEVEKRLGSKTPKQNLPTDQPITKEMFNKMSLAEQMRLYNENPEIYNQF